jgi:hypothetical protein
VILGKFWSRYDLQNFRKRDFLGDDHGELSKSTVSLIGVRFFLNYRGTKGIKIQIGYVLY